MKIIFLKTIQNHCLDELPIYRWLDTPSQRNLLLQIINLFPEKTNHYAKRLCRRASTLVVVRYSYQD